MPGEADVEEYSEKGYDSYEDVSFVDMSGGQRGISRIPISKSSPLPIPLEHLERDTPIRRMPSAVFGEEEPLSNPKSRGRSQSVKQLAEAAIITPTPAKRQPSEKPLETNNNSSPTKKAAGPRKTSTNSARTPSAQQRPKTRSGSNREQSGHRPTTSSGQPHNSIKQPEGDPPWLASMYKPDPRLPPDQQLLPTVAKRLQQEQWEKEGKFGTVYDTSFRPLNDNVIPPPQFKPKPLPRQPPEREPTPEIEEAKPHENEFSNWPLRSPKPASLMASRPGTATGGSYSTMPKISSTPQSLGVHQNPVLQPPSINAQDQDRPVKEKGGCGCCAVM